MAGIKTNFKDNGSKSDKKWDIPRNLNLKIFKYAARPATDPLVIEKYQIRCRVTVNRERYIFLNIIKQRGYFGLRFFRNKPYLA